jgi:GAF domain/PilZ domain/Sel1 repeat
MQTSGNSLAANSREPQSAYPERRQCVRQKIHIPAYANLGGSTSGMVLDLSEILDISERGMCIQTASPLPRNLTLPMVLDLAETKAYLHTMGTVVWTDPAGRAGISFPEMPGESRQQLKEWLFANAIAACVNHEEAALPLIEDEVLVRAEQFNPRVVVSVDEEDFEPPGLPDYTTLLIALAAVKREVDSTGRNLEKTLMLIADRALSFTRASGAAIALVDKSNWEEIVCRSRAGADAPPVGTKLDLGSSFSGECIRTGKLIRCEDSETDPRVDRESCRLLGIRSMVAVPVRNDHAVLGLLEVFSPQAGAFISNDDMVLQRLAEMIAGAIKSASQIAPGKASPARVSPVQVMPVKDRPAANGGFARSDAVNRGLGSTPTSAEPPATQKSAAAEPSHDSSTPWFGRVLLAASAATLIAALAWAAAPWVKTRMQAFAPLRPKLELNSNKSALKSPAPAQSSAADPESMQRLAEQGDAVAQFEVGARYATGEDVPQDYSQALSWFLKSAEQGNVPAQATLGAYYWAGRGVPQDLSKAYYWAILAEAGGDESSKYRVALLASRLSRTQILAEQKQAEEWIKAHQTLAKGSSHSTQ